VSQKLHIREIVFIKVMDWNNYSKTAHTYAHLLTY